MLAVSLGLTFESYSTPPLLLRYFHIVLSFLSPFWYLHLAQLPLGPAWSCWDESLPLGSVL